MHSATTELVEAIAGGYIGEVSIVPRKIADAVHWVANNRRLWSGVVYYYGEPDKELDELFGYLAANVELISGSHTQLK